MKKKRYIVTAIILILLVLITIFFLSSISLSNEVVNGGFEELDSNFQPLNWIRVGRPFINIDTFYSHSGSNAAKISANNYYIQNPSASENLAYTLGTYIKGDTGNETAVSTITWRMSNDLVYNVNSWRASADNEYCLNLFNFLSPQDTYSADINNSTRYRNEWVFEDDVFLIDEILDNRGFEIPSLENPAYPQDWQNVGSPFYDKSGTNSHSGSSAIAVNSNNYFYQDVGIATPNKTYVLSFWAKAQSFLIKGLISVEVIDYSAEIIFSDNFTFDTINSYQLYSFSITPPKDAVLLRISLKSQNFTQSVFYDDIHLFFHSPYPDKFSPNNDDFRDTTDIYFLLDSDATVSMDILDNQDNLIEKLLDEIIFPIGVHKVTWDGIDKNTSIPLPDGTYRFSMTIDTADSNNIVFSGNVILDTSHSYSKSSVTINNFFPVGIWFSDGMGMFYYPGYYNVSFEDIAQHNFNTVIVNGFSNDNAIEMLAAAESNNLKIIYNDYDLQLDIYNAVFFEPLNEELMRNKVQNLINLIGSSNALLGYYLFDEPQFIEAQDLKELRRLFEDLDPSRLSFCGFYPLPQMNYTLDTIGLKTVLIDYYVIGDINQSVGDLNGFVSKLLEIENLALDKNLPAWIILQGVSVLDIPTRMPTPEEIRCQAYLSIAHNFKGIFYFLYQSLSEFYLQGLTDSHQNPSEMYTALTQLNSELITLSPTVLDLTPYEFSASISNNAIIKTFKDSVSTRFLIVVNTNCTEDNNVSIQTEDTGIKKIINCLNSTEIPFTTDGSQVSFSINLPSGDGRVLKLSTQNSKINLSNYRDVVVGNGFKPFPTKKKPEEITNYYSYDTLHPANSIAFYNNYVFVSESSNTIEIVDISDPQNIQYVSAITGYNATNLLVKDNELFIADNQYGLTIYDISNITSPQLLGEYFGHTGNASDVEVVNNTAFLASGSRGLKILDISDPVNITELGVSGNAFDATSIEIKDNYAFITDLNDGLTIYDFSIPSTPATISKVDTFSHAWDIKIDSNNAFIAANEYGLVIVDISNPIFPSVKGNIRTRSAYNLDKYGQFVLLADGTGGIKIIDCGNLLFPKLWAEYKVFKTEIVRDVKIHNGYAFIAYGNAGIVSIPLRELIPTLVQNKLWELY